MCESRIEARMEVGCERSIWVSRYVDGGDVNRSVECGKSERVWRSETYMVR